METRQYLRLVLFDIDGTLITTNGRARSAFLHAFEEEFDNVHPVPAHSFAGKTDPQIYREMCTLAGIPNDIAAAKRDRFFDTFFRILERLLIPDSVSVLPGVHQLLHELVELEASTPALLTGNMLQSARLKLTPPDLLQYFGFGAFGNDAEERYDLPEIAVSRAYDRTGATFRAKEIVIIGDTPNDIACGEHLNVRTIAVCTGTYSREQLAQHRPDFLFDDLSDLEKILDAIFD